MSATIERDWRLRGPVWPAVRRGSWAAVPVGLGILFDLGFSTRVAGALATGAMIAGFVAFDAPARTRALWQAMAAPLIGLLAGLGILSSGSGIVAVAVMTLCAGAAGFCVAVSQRLAIAALSGVLALLIAQGLNLGAGEAWRALLVGTGGGLAQAAFSLAAGIRDRDHEDVHLAAGMRGAREAFARNLSFRSHALRHALRWGLAMGAAVAVYRFIDMQGHGYWVPLTVLFVLRPEVSDTRERLAMRAVGTIAGLAIATGLAQLLGYHVVLTALLLSAAAALSFALLAIEYALFTTAITVFVVLLSDALGEDAVKAAAQRGLATAIGIGLAAAAIMLWPNRPDVPAPDAASR